MLVLLVLLVFANRARNVSYIAAGEGLAALLSIDPEPNKCSTNITIEFYLVNSLDGLSPSSSLKLCLFGLTLTGVPSAPLVVDPMLFLLRL